jgi:hypothetical protein
MCGVGDDREEGNQARAVQPAQPGISVRFSVEVELE